MNSYAEAATTRNTGLSNSSSFSEAQVEMMYKELASANPTLAAAIPLCGQRFAIASKLTQYLEVGSS